MIQNLLNYSKDKYLIVPCTSKKEYVLSLSEEVVISEFMLLNTEEFSSRIELFNLYGSTTYPTNNWEKLGTFLAKEVIGEWQSFPVKKTWSRYLKFEWKTTYGFQYYCTLTQIQVCGLTMAQGLKDDLQNIQFEDSNQNIEPEIVEEINHFESSSIFFEHSLYPKFDDSNASDDVMEEILSAFPQPLEGLMHSDFIDLCSKPTIWHILERKCPLNYQIPITTFSTSSKSSNKLNEVFVTI